MHILGVQVTVKNFDVTTTTVDILFMFNRKLDDKWLILVAEWRELC